MATLKNRNQQIPNSLTFFQPETGFKPRAWSSFDSICAQVIAHRKGNAHLARKYNWALETRDVEKEVDKYNASICAAQGWNDFINVETTFPKMLPPRRSFTQVAGAALAGAKRSVVGIKVVTRWLGSGLKPVAPELAEKRASVCVACKENNMDPNWLQKLDATVATEIKSLAEVRNDLQLKTSHDAKLGSCNVCDCSLPLKVFVPLDHIIKETSEKTMAELKAVKPPCWQITEQQ